jgi:hypothetical protein
LDLNQLLYHHQLALLRVSRRPPDDRDEPSLVDHYARRIRDRLETDDAPLNPVIWSQTIQ